MEQKTSSQGMLSYTLNIHKGLLGMEQKTIKRVMLTAVIWNWSSAISLFCYEDVMALYGVGPLPNHPLWIFLMGALTGAFGVGYLMVSLNLAENIPILKLGVVGKVAVFFVGLYCAITIGDLLSIGFFCATVLDLMYGFFFVYVIRVHNNTVSTALDQA